MSTDPRDPEVPGLPDEPDESAAAREAWLDYFDLGFGRSLNKLLALYQERHAQGRDVPTRNRRTLEVWSAEHRWQERLIDRQRSVAEQAEADLVGERKAFARQRMNEARALHTIGGAVAQEIIRRVQAGELAQIPLIGYWTSVDFTQQSVEQDWTQCPDCGGTGRVSGTLVCFACQGEGRTYLGKGRRRTVAGTKVVKVDGLMDYATAVVKMVQVGQGLERTELGQSNPTEELLNVILTALPEQLRAEVYASAAGALVAGTDRRGGGPEHPGAGSQERPPRRPVDHR